MPAVFGSLVVVVVVAVVVAAAYLSFASALTNDVNAYV